MVRWGLCSQWLLAMAVLSASAVKAETASVKASTLVEVRAQLTTYDLSADGTTKVLARLAQIAREHAGDSAGEEARFLQLAVGADLSFIADFTSDAALRSRVAETFGVAPDALHAQLAQGLGGLAHGIYEQPAKLALHGLASEPDMNAHDPRSDALLLRRTLGEVAESALPERLAQLGREPCPAAVSCQAPYAGLDPHARRALWMGLQLTEAEQRLARAAQQGDPLAGALAQPLAGLQATLASLRLPVLPQLDPELAVIADAAPERWLQLAGIWVVDGQRVLHYAVPRRSLAELRAASALPQPVTVVTLHDLPSYTRPLEEVVSSARDALAQQPGAVFGVAASADTPSHVFGRLLVSLSKAGVAAPVVIGSTAAGDWVGVPVHVTLTSPDAPGPIADIRLRIRLGGYTLRVGNLVSDLPRVQDGAGYHFDLPRLSAALAKSTAHSAAISFMGDLAARQLQAALFCLPKSLQRVELLVQ
jgi:hypothetical protein